MQDVVKLPDELAAIVAPYWQRLEEHQDFNGSPLAQLLENEKDFSNRARQARRG